MEVNLHRHFSAFNNVMFCMNCKVIFSAIQPTGRLHLGNYLGAVRPWISLCSSSSCDSSTVFIALADLHAMTSLSHKYSSDCSTSFASNLIATGLDPRVFSKLVLFRQSKVSEHTLLSWILTCLCPIGKLQRMTQFKERSRILPNGTESISAGLLTYPVLQAADILLYRATHVPVGEDQMQHLELCRFLANKLVKTRLLSGFPIPKPLITPKDIGGRIMSLKDPMKKMSKSDPDDNSRINIDDKEDIISRKIKNALTENFPNFGIPIEQMTPPMANLMTIYFALSDTPKKTFNSIQEFKANLIDAIIKELQPIQKQMKSLSATDTESILIEGEKKASVCAKATMNLINNSI